MVCFVGQKTGEFKETWLLESVLQLKQEAHTNHSFEIGQKVQLATSKFELTETQKNGLVTQEPTLYYPPVMVIIMDSAASSTTFLKFASKKSTKGNAIPSTGEENLNW